MRPVGDGKVSGHYWSLYKPVRLGKTAPIEFIPWRVTTARGFFPIYKLSTELSTRDGTDVARHQLTRQVPHRHVLTLPDTTCVVLVLASG